MRRVLWILAGALVLMAPFGAARLSVPFGASRLPTATAVQLEADMPYTLGSNPLKLDLARPVTGNGPFPAVVCLHWGGWVDGSRKQMHDTIQVLARRGYVAVVPDYRLAPRYPFPAAVEDCKTCVRWLRENAERLHVDGDHIGVVGIAAGGHLACLVGVTEPTDGLEGKAFASQSSKVQAVVSFFGPTDLTAGVWSEKARKYSLEPFLGGTFKQMPEKYQKASPIHYSCKNAPPFLFLHGSADAIVPPSQSEELATHIRQAGGSAEVVLYSGETHGFSGWKAETLAQGIDRMLTFFDKTLKH
jgi:acetyl esterase/lipase